MSEVLTKEKYAALLAKVKSGNFVHFGGRSAGNIEQLEFIAKAEGLTIAEKVVAAAEAQVSTESGKDTTPPVETDDDKEKKQKVSLAKRAVTIAEKVVAAAEGEDAIKTANEKLEEAKKALAELSKD